MGARSQPAAPTETPLDQVDYGRGVERLDGRARRTSQISLVATGLLLLGLGCYALLRRFLRRRARPLATLPGWQLYDAPTDGGPPGSVFRINPDGVRYQVTMIPFPVELAKLATQRSRWEIKTSITQIARFVDALPKIDGSLAEHETVELEMTQPTHEVTYDVDTEEMVKSESRLEAAMAAHPKDRFYVIREAHKTTHLELTISQTQASHLTIGSAPLSDRVNLGLNIRGSGDGSKKFVWDEWTDELRVLYLPQEIRRGKTGNVLTLAGVSEPLEQRPPRGDESGEGEGGREWPPFDRLDRHAQQALDDTMTWEGSPNTAELVLNILRPTLSLQRAFTRRRRRRSCKATSPTKPPAFRQPASRAQPSHPRRGLRSRKGSRGSKAG